MKSVEHHVKEMFDSTEKKKRDDAEREKQAQRSREESNIQFTESKLRLCFPSLLSDVECKASIKDKQLHFSFKDKKFVIANTSDGMMRQTDDTPEYEAYSWKLLSEDGEEWYLGRDMELNYGRYTIRPSMQDCVFKALGLIFSKKPQEEKVREYDQWHSDQKYKDPNYVKHITGEL